MIIFLYGSDSYRRQKKQQWIIAEYRKKHSALTIERFDLAEEGAWERLGDCVKNQSLFDPCALAIIRGVYAIADDTKKVSWLKSLQDAPGIVVLIVADSAPLKVFSFLLKKPTMCNECKPLDGFALQAFVTAEAAARGAHLSAASLAELHTVYRDDLWGLMTELDTRAVSGAIQPPLSCVPVRRDFFSLAKILAYGRRNEKLSALEELLLSGDLPKTFNMLAALVSQAQKKQMADYDVAVKSGMLDYETALLDFAIQ